MEFRTAEEKLLHDYFALEEENARLKDENAILNGRIDYLLGRIDEYKGQAHMAEVERDHHADCVTDMLATAAFYGFEQPDRIAYNEKTGMMMAAAPDGPDGKCAVYGPESEGDR